MSVSNSESLIPLVEIVFVPMAGEEANLETISLIEGIRIEVGTMLSEVPGYVVQGKSDGARSSSILIILWKIAHHVASNAQSIATLLQAGTSTLQTVAKRKNVAKIEITLGEDSLRIEDADPATVERLITLFEAKHKGSPFPVSTAPLQIIATITGTPLIVEPSQKHEGH